MTSTSECVLPVLSCPYQVHIRVVQSWGTLIVSHCSCDILQAFCWTANKMILFNKVLANPWNLLWSWICYSSAKGRGILIFHKPELFFCALTTLHMSVACFYDDTTTFAHNSIVSQVLWTMSEWNFTATLTQRYHYRYYICAVVSMTLSWTVKFSCLKVSRPPQSVSVLLLRKQEHQYSCTWGHCLNQAQATWEEADEGVLSAVPRLDPPFFIYYHWPWWEQMLLDLCPNGRPKCDGVLIDM